MDDSDLPDDLKEILEHSFDSNISTDNDESNSNEDLEKKKEEISRLAASLIFGSIDDAKCRIHRREPLGIESDVSCSDCDLIKERVLLFNTHGCTFSCKKKKKMLKIKENEGHGKLDGKMSGNSIDDYIICRYNFPQYPIDETILLLGLSKDHNEEDLKQRKTDYKKIRKFLIRQTNSDEAWENLKSMSFNKFLVEVGMLDVEKSFEQCSTEDIKKAKKRYLNALEVSIKGTGSIIIRREPKDIFTNNLMLIHGANHDVQLCPVYLWVSHEK